MFLCCDSHDRLTTTAPIGWLSELVRTTQCALGGAGVPPDVLRTPGDVDVDDFVGDRGDEVVLGPRDTRVGA